MGQIGERPTHSHSHIDKEVLNTARGLAVITLVVDGHTEVRHLMSLFAVEVLDLQTYAVGSTCLAVLDSSRNTDRTHQWPEKGGRRSPL